MSEEPIFFARRYAAVMWTDIRPVRRTGTAGGA